MKQVGNTKLVDGSGRRILLVSRLFPFESFLAGEEELRPVKRLACSEKDCPAIVVHQAMIELGF